MRHSPAVTLTLASLFALAGCTDRLPRTDLTLNDDVEVMADPETPSVRTYEVRDLYANAPDPAATFEKLLLDIAALKPAPKAVTYDSGMLAIKATAASHAQVIKLLTERRAALKAAKKP